MKYCSQSTPFFIQTAFMKALLVLLLDKYCLFYLFSLLTEIYLHEKAFILRIAMDLHF